MARPKTNSRQITVSLTPDIWASLDAEKGRRPFDPMSEIIRDRLRTTIKNPSTKKQQH